MITEKITTDSQPEGMLEGSEPKNLKELFGDKPSPQFDPSALEMYVRTRYKEEIEGTFKLMHEKETMSLKERASAVNTNNAITGIMVMWSLIGVLMLGRSCINTDPGPKFKV